MPKTIVPPRTDDPVEVRRYQKQVAETINKRQATAQADSTASDVATLKADFNSLLAKLRAADLMASP